MKGVGAWKTRDRERGDAPRFDKRVPNWIASNEACQPTACADCTERSSPLSYPGGGLSNAPVSGWDRFTRWPWYSRQPRLSAPGQASLEAEYRQPQRDRPVFYRLMPKDPSLATHDKQLQEPCTEFCAKISGVLLPVLVKRPIVLPYVQNFRSRPNATR